MPKVKMFPVYEQLPPTPTGEKFKARDWMGEYTSEWHTANLKFVGKAATFADAKLLCKNPIMEAE